MAGGLSWLYAWETMALDGYVVALAKPDFAVTPTGGTVTISLRAAPDTAGHGSGLAVMPGSRGAGGYSRCEPCGPTPRVQRGGKQSRESKRACSAEGCWGPTSRGSILRPRLAGPGHGYNEFAVPLASTSSPRGAKLTSTPVREDKAGTRADLPLKPKDQSTRGSAALALAILESKPRLEAAKAALRADYYANSSRATVNSKRTNVAKMATAATAGNPFPLEVGTVEAVAAALKAAGLKSGSAYLAELRLMHIEAGWEVSAQLARGFDLGRRGIDRGKGPPSKAAELKMEDLLAEGQADSGPVFAPRASYITAQRWLLREIELANLDMDDAWIEQSDEKGRQRERAVLSLPVSKTDTHGAGAIRKLAHTCGPEVGGPMANTEYTTCPVCTLKSHVTTVREHFGTDWTGPLFPDWAGNRVSKADTVAAWQTLAPSDHDKLGGHSARRSGAKRYARLGWQLSAIQYLGRWASTAVLGYIEDMMAEMTGSGTFEDWQQAVPQLLKRLADAEAFLERCASSIGSTAARAETAVQMAEEKLKSTEDIADSVLPAAVVWTDTPHRLASRSTAHPTAAWKTSCGRRLHTDQNFVFMTDKEARLKFPDITVWCARCRRKD